MDKQLERVCVTGIYNDDLKNWKWACRRCNIQLDLGKYPVGFKCIDCVRTRMSYDDKFRHGRCERCRQRWQRNNKKKNDK